MLSALSILNKIPWINAEKLTGFILSAQVNIFSQLLDVSTLTTLQDPEGGIADRPGDQPDVFHTHFGVAGNFMRCARWRAMY